MSTRRNLRAVRDGDDGGGREATRTRGAGGKKEGRRRMDCGMDIFLGGGRGGRRATAAMEFSSFWRRKCRRDDWAKMGQVLTCECVMGKGGIKIRRFHCYIFFSVKFKKIITVQYSFLSLDA